MMAETTTLERKTFANPEEALLNAWRLFGRRAISVDELRHVVESLISARRDDDETYPENVTSGRGATSISEDEIYRAAPQKMGRRQ